MKTGFSLANTDPGIKDPAALTECVSWYVKHLAELSPLCLSCHSFRHPDDKHLVFLVLVAVQSILAAISYSSD